MKTANLFLAGLAGLALIGCGKEDAAGGATQTEASQEALSVDASSPLESAFRLKDAEAVDAEALFALIPDASRPTYDSVAFDESIGATVFENLRFADSDDGEAVVVRRAEFYGVDLEAIDRVRTASDAGPDAPFETVLRKARFFDVGTEGFETDEMRIAFGGVEIDNLAIRQGGVDGDGEGDDTARFFNAVNLSGLYFKDIEIEAQGEAAPGVVMTAPDLRFVGLGGGKLAAVIANDFAYEVNQSAEVINAMREAMGPQAALLMAGPLQNLIAPENQNVAIEAFAWRDIDLSGLMEWGLKGETPPVEERALIDLGTVKASNIEAFIAGRKVSTIEEATLSNAEFTWLAPSRFRADTKGAVYDLTAYVPETEEDAIQILKDAGLDAIKGDGYADWRWSANSGAASLDYVADTEGFADFTMGLQLSGLKLKEIAEANESGEAQPVAALGKFNGFSMSLKDEKALDAMFAIAALQMGGDGEDLRVSAPAMIRLSAAQFAQGDSPLGDYIDAIADFVGKGGTLEIKAQPEAPVALLELQDAGASPMALPETLGLTITHKED
ncbi:MAG: hypothetical protein ACX939_00220 [Hyphococcus sp.]